MKQKLLNTTLYVFDVNPYTITEDASEATVIKVQEESYKGFVEMNPDLIDKLTKYNFHVICVNTPEWAPYVEQEDPQESLTFGIYGAAAVDAINQIQVQNADNEVLYHWDAPDIQFPFQCNVEEGQHCVVECKDGISDLFSQFDVEGSEYLPVRWVDEETGNTWYATYPITDSISIGINAVEPSTTHTVEITSDIAMSEIMEQTPDHQTIVNTYTSPSSPFTMTVNGGNIVTVEFDNGEPSDIYDIDPNGFFAGQWQNPDTGKYISWSNQIFDDVNVTIATPQPSTYTFVLEGSYIHQNVTVKVNDETTSYTPEQLVDGVQLNDGDVIDVYPTQNAADYSLVSGATWDTDHWTATVNGANVDIWINYLGAGVNFVASWFSGSTPENVDEILIGSTSVTGNDLTNKAYSNVVRLYPGSSQIKYFISTGLPTDMSHFDIKFMNYWIHYAYKQTDPDTGEVFYLDAEDASGTTLQHPGIWTYDNNPDSGLPWIAFTLPEVDENGNAFVDNTLISIDSKVTGS